MGAPFVLSRSWRTAVTTTALGSVLEAAERLVAPFTARTGVRVDAMEAVLGRAAIAGLRPPSSVSAGGSCRLLLCGRDGEQRGLVAINLARAEDAEAVGAIVGDDVAPGDAWAALTAWVPQETAGAVATRCQLLGVPAAALGAAADVPALRVQRVAPREHENDLAGSRVVDLTSMWAGPLCAHLLGRAGAEVVKVESAQRPDGARRGPKAFFEWLHQGHANLTLDLHQPAGRHELRALLEEADIVLESSRPRALRQWGIAAEDVVRRSGGLWVSITGYGRSGPGADLVAFGDDAGVAGGLVDHRAEEVRFLGDAIADPLSGLLAATAAAGSTERGVVLEVTLAGVAATVAAGLATEMTAATATDPVRAESAGD